MIFSLKRLAVLPFLAVSAQIQGMQAMVDPIGIKTGAVVDRSTLPVAAAATTATTAATVDAEAPAPLKSEPDAVEASAPKLSQTMAAEAPVDPDRVARIRKAIQEGRFPMVPSTVADRLLALKLQWSSNDQA
jgi:negative regulator of flagellin synthesis FlgM